jgi:phage repressor protein C with HTH and peptisase S24 domain
MYASRQDAASTAGCSKQSLDKYMKGEQSPTLKTMFMLANGAGISLDWLATGDGPMLQSDRQYGTAMATAEPLAPYDAPRPQTGLQAVSDVKDTLGNPVDLAEFTFIPRYAAKASAGHGADTQDCGKPLFSMAFRRYWIKHYLRADPANLAVISVKGDSMDGVLNDRDVILIDLADAAPTGGLYVVRQGADLLVKRVQKLTGGRLLLLSANPAYVPVEVDPARDEDFAVVGRVVWFGRQI